MQSRGGGGHITGVGEGCSGLVPAASRSGAGGELCSQALQGPVAVYGGRWRKDGDGGGGGSDSGP
jgi:hypothetical protein